MDRSSFLRQDETPLFPKILWNRPVSRGGAGRLLAVGGHSGDFSLITGLFEAATAAGLGECTVLLPDSLLKLLGGTGIASFVPSSPSGSLGREGLGRILSLSEEADAIAVGANLSNNSDTAILIERILQEAERPIIAFDDALVALQHHLPVLTNNPNNLIILTMPEVFKLANALMVPITIRRDGGLVNKIEIIENLRAATKCSYVVYGSEIIVAAGDTPIVTPVNYRLSLVPSLYYGVLSVFWLQNPTQRREGLATGAYILSQAAKLVGGTARPAASTLNREITRLLSLEHD